MRIAVTSQGPGADDAVDPRFGRAGYIVLIDTDVDEVTGHANETNAQALQGAGVQTASLVAELGAEVVLTGNVGPKAYATLKAAGLDVYVGADGSVQQAVECFHSGQLESAVGPTVQGHNV